MIVSKMNNAVKINNQQELGCYVHQNAVKFGITSYELLVLLALALHMEKANYWVCNPSNKEIAKLCLCSERSVTNAIKSLSDKGIINNRKGTSHGNNRYNINIQKLASLCGVGAVFDGCVLNVFTGKNEVHYEKV